MATHLGKVSWAIRDELYKYNLRNCNAAFFCFSLGIYFAKHATYADKYSTSSKDLLPLHGGEAKGVPGKSTKIMFLARVMIGKSNHGQKHFQKPDHGSPVNTHYSCVDDMEHPKVFVIFDPNQIYPEYLIQYRWGQERKYIYLYVYLKDYFTRCTVWTHDLISFHFLLFMNVRFPRFIFVNKFPGRTTGYLCFFLFSVSSVLLLGIKGQSKTAALRKMQF